jgi:hypothetical protein
MQTIQWRAQAVAISCITLTSALAAETPAAVPQTDAAGISQKAAYLNNLAATGQRSVGCSDVE